MNTQKIISHGHILSKFIKTKEWKYIHVFTDGKDEHIKWDEVEPCYSDALKKAHEIKNKWIEEGETNIRIYCVHEQEDYRDGEIIQLEERLLFSLGNYPY